MHIIEDIRAYKRNDPAARSALEILLQMLLDLYGEEENA